jgi:hypothetical protein
LNGTKEQPVISIADEQIVPCRRAALLGWGGAMAVALALYGMTMAPDLVWHDAGYYQWEAARLNLVRPGEAVRVHPFFIMVAHGLGRIGLWNYAKAASVASALGTALAVANVWLIVYRLTRRLWPAVLAALSCMLAHTIWQQGVQPQTYGWTNAVISGMILASIVYVETARPRWLMVLFLLGGIGMGIHLMSQLAVAVLGVWVLGRVLRGRTAAWVLPAGVGLWFLGAALFWYVAYLEFQRTGDWTATARSALLGGWGAAVFNLGGVPRMLWRSLLMAGLNFPTPVALLGLVGLWRSRRLLAGTPLALLLGLLLAVYILFAVRYRVPNQNFFFTPVYLMLALYLGLGIHAIGWAERPWPRLALLVLVLAVIPTYRGISATARAAGFNLRPDRSMHEIPYRDVYTYYLEPWQHTQTGPRRFAEEALTALPPGALLLPDTTTSPPLKGLHDIEGRRPDIRIVDPYDAKFDPNVSRYWYGADNLLPALTREGRRVFVVSDAPFYVPKWVADHGRLAAEGPIFEVVPAEAKGLK